MTTPPVDDPFAEIKKRATEAHDAKTDPGKNTPITQIYSKEITQQASERLQSQLVFFRKRLLSFILILMACETVALFTIVILTSLPTKPLDIHDTTLQIFTSATIAQISAMLIIIVRSVFSDKLNPLIMSVH